MTEKVNEPASVSGFVGAFETASALYHWKSNQLQLQQLLLWGRL